MSPLYIPDPNNSKKQMPSPVTGSAAIGVFSFAEAPASKIIQKRPSYVVMNGPGTYAFLYHSTSSAGGEAYGTATTLDGGNYVTASTVADGASVKLDISPLAWIHATDVATGVTGQVTFVYKKTR